MTNHGQIPKSRFPDDAFAKLPDWLRWPLIPFSGAAGFVLVALMGTVGLGYVGLADLARYLNNTVGTAAFVVVGAKCAPRHQFITAIVLTVLCSLFFGAMIALAWVRLPDAAVYSTFEFIEGAAGAILGCLAVKMESDRTDAERRVKREQMEHILTCLDSLKIGDKSPTEEQKAMLQRVFPNYDDQKPTTK